LKIKLRQWSGGANISFHNEDMSRAAFARNILLQNRQNNWKNLDFREKRRGLML